MCESDAFPFNKVTSEISKLSLNQMFFLFNDENK